MRTGPAGTAARASEKLPLLSAVAVARVVPSLPSGLTEAAVIAAPFIPFWMAMPETESAGVGVELGVGLGDGLGDGEVVAVGDGLGVGELIMIGVGDGVGLGVGVGDGVAVGSGVGVGLGDGDGVGEGDGVGVGVGVGVPTKPSTAPISQAVWPEPGREPPR